MTFNIFSVIGDDKLNAEKQLIKDQIDSDLGLLIDELPDDQKEVGFDHAYLSRHEL